RDSTGVRGIRLDDGNLVISMAILIHVNATPAERATYLKQASALRRAHAEEAEEVEDAHVVEVEADAEDEDGTTELSSERFAELSAKEQFVLTISDRGYGKRSSAYEYRVSGRGGKGIAAMVVNDRNGQLVAAFPIDDSDQIILVTDAGQLIRCPVDDVRIASRNTQGVRVFRTSGEERVVSVERISEDESEDGDDAPEAGEGTAPEPPPSAE
ncbi:MAG: DNA gyrase subunit A, partial [Hyphomicrobiaceae bacterium]|nr:DNA gyrase subunit A [Hyphomicrobiaceae bacterium]